MQEEGLYYC